MHKTTIVDIEKVEHPSLRHGYWFFFDAEDAVIAAHGSTWSGMERVYVNNELVSEVRNLTRHSDHHFELNGEPHTVKFEVASMLKGELLCTLFKHAEPVEQQTKTYYRGKSSWRSMLGQLLAGFVCGFALAYIITDLL